MIGRMRRAARRDDGAAAVEFALIFPIFVLLAFGTIAAGFAFARQINITQAAREASRYGSTLSVAASAPGNAGTTSTWLAKVATAADNAAGTGIFDGATTRCVSLTLNGTTSHKTGTSSPASGACPGAPSSSLTNYVQVVLTRTTDFNLIVTDPTLTLKSSSTTPYEATT